MKIRNRLKLISKLILFSIIVILILTPVLADNDPGHDTLYIEEQGDSELNGTLNITNNMSVEGGRTYQSAGLTLYGNGYTSAPGTGAYVSGLSDTHDLYLEGQGNVYIKYVSGGDTVYIGKAGITATDLNVSGALYVQSGSSRIAGQLICLANGSNCPGGTNTGNVTSVTESGTGPLVITPNTGDVTIAITIPTCTASQKLLYNGTAFNCSTDLDSGGTGDIASVQAENTYIYNGSDTGAVYLRFNQSLLNDTIDKRATALSDGNNYTSQAGFTTSGSTETLQIAIVGRDNVTASFTDTDTTYSNGTGLALSGTTFSIKACGNTEILKYNTTTSQWECKTDTDSDTTYTNSTGIALSGTTFSLAAGVITAGKYGNNTAVPVCTFDTYGRATSCTNTSINFPTSTDLNNYTIGIGFTTSGTTVTLNLNRSGTAANITTSFNDQNNYTQNVEVTGTTTKSINFNIIGRTAINATFTDIDTTIGNCSADGSCTAITYDSETTNWDKTSSDDITTSSTWTGGDLSGTGLAPQITDSSHAHSCTNITGATSNLCTITDTNTGNCSTAGSCTAIIYTNTNFNNASTSDINVSGTYNTLDLQIKTGAVGSTELASTSITAGSYGNATAVPVCTFDADGRATSCTNTSINFPTSTDQNNYTISQGFTTSGNTVTLNLNRSGTAANLTTSFTQLNNYTIGIGFTKSGSTVTLNLNRSGTAANITTSFTDDNTGNCSTAGSCTNIIYTTSTWSGGDLSGTGLAPSVTDDSHNHVYSNIDSTTSSNWASIVSDETGTGSWVFNNSPVITNPTINYEYVSGASGMRVIKNPGGGYWNNNSPDIAGALKISLPGTFSNTMVYLVIKGYEYDTDGSWEVLAGGYAYSTGTWINAFAIVLSGNPPFTRLRFGNESATPVIVLGTTVGDGGATDFDYPKVWIDEVSLGYSGVSNAWESGWVLALDTDVSDIAFSDDETTTQVWSANNDGAGSGLDADTVDGFNSSSFINTSTGGTYQTGTDQNNYTTAAGVTSSGLTKTIQIAILGRSNVTASWTDNNTDTNNYTISQGFTTSGNTVTLNLNRSGTAANITTSFTQLNNYTIGIGFTKSGSTVTLNLNRSGTAANITTSFTDDNTGNCSSDGSCSAITYDSETTSWDKTSSDDLTTSTSWTGDLGGTGSSPTVDDDSHIHTSSTVTINGANITAGTVADARIASTIARTGTCSGSQVAQNTTSSGVQCRTVITTETGDISSVTAGNGLTGGGTTGAITLTVNSQTCGTGNYSYYNGTGFECRSDETYTGTDQNNYTSQAGFVTSGSTETLQIAIIGRSNVTASFTDTDTTIGNCSSSGSCTNILYSGGTLTTGYACFYDGTGIDCNRTTDGSGDCTTGAVCLGGHTHSTYQTGTEQNNYTSQAGFVTSGSTETLQIAIIGRSNVTASFTDTDTTYSNGTGLALSSTTFSLAAGVITAGKYGNTTAVPVCTFDTYGRATTCTNTSISFPASSGGDGTGGWTNTTTVVSLVDSNDLVGIGTSSPDAKLDIERTSTQLRLGYSSTVNANFTVDSSGNLTIRSSSKNVVIQLG